MVRMVGGATGAKLKKIVRAVRARDILGVPLETVKTLFQVRNRVDSLSIKIINCPLFIIYA